jgi:hypothetical protein
VVRQWIVTPLFAGSNPVVRPFSRIKERNKVFIFNYIPFEGKVVHLSADFLTVFSKQAKKNALYLYIERIFFCLFRSFACFGEGGIRTHGNSHHVGFQDQDHKPLGHLS